MKYLLLVAFIACVVRWTREPSGRPLTAEFVGLTPEDSATTDVEEADATAEPKAVERGAADRARASTREASRARDPHAASGPVGSRRDVTNERGLAVEVPDRAALPGSVADAARPRMQARAALLRPTDFDRLIATVRDELRLELQVTPEAELDLLRRAAESGRPESLLNLGLYLAYATEGGGGSSLAAELFWRAYSAGSMRALAELGRLHLTGKGVPLDPELAAAYFEQARSAGDSEATFLLAMSNRLELFDGAEPGRVRDLLRQAAEGGHVAAQVAAYLLQVNSELNFGGVETVVPWLEAAAQAGDAKALFYLADYYDREDRTDDALITLMTAAEAGSSQAREWLALSLYDGRLTSKSVPRALQLVREMTAVPDLADGRALFLRAFLEWNSNQDPKYWLSLSEARGDHRAKITRLRLERGDDARTVFRETGPLDTQEAYLKLIELSDEFARSSQGKRGPAAPISAPSPPYPAELLVTRQHGRAAVTFTVDPQGRVTELKVVEASHPAFAASALETVAGWRFKPGFKNGEPVATKMMQSFRFDPR